MESVGSIPTSGASKQVVPRSIRGGSSKFLHHRLSMYSNCKMISQYGDVLAYVDRKRMNWYLERNLARLISDQEFQLTFAHNIKDASYDVEFLPRESKCVVCGTDGDLKRHHVVPYCFRRYFGEKYKSHNSYDVLALCGPCHIAYEREAENEKRSQRDPLINKAEVSEITRNLKAAKGLLTNYSRMPQHSIDRVWGYLPEVGSRDLTELPAFIYKQSCRLKEANAATWAAKIVSSMGEEQIVLFWRKHFLAHAKPQHLPQGWLEQQDLVLTKGT